ncbi:MAG TPA: GxxExxY protein [Longimicrobiaceae bacterium]|nr:GxxExxY protein [Longimicrobiaceae bacterium]
MQGERPLEALTERAIGCAIAVHRALGPGLLESVYKACLRIELEESGLRVDTERRIPLRYRGRVVAADLVCDLLVEEQLLLELKSVEHIHPVHLAQVITYLKLSGCPVGLLINFNTTSLRSGLRRLEHPDVYSPRMWRATPDRDTPTAPRRASSTRLTGGNPTTETPPTTTNPPSTPPELRGRRFE